MLKYDSEIPITDDLKYGKTDVRHLEYNSKGVWTRFENVPSTDVLIRARVYDNEWNNITSGSSITINGEAVKIKKLASGTSYTIKITPPAGYAPMADITGVTDNQPLIDYKLIASALPAKARLRLTDGSMVSIPITGETDTTIYHSETEPYKDSIKSVEVFSGVTTIGDEAFGDASASMIYKNLKTITLPSTLTTIGKEAFAYAYNLTSIAIPDGVTTIGESAFGACRGLLSITIPAGVTSIGSQAFVWCRALTSVTVNATTPPTLGADAFREANNCPIYVPAASVDAYKAAEGWSTYASRIQPIP